MRILIDACLPVELKGLLQVSEVKTAREMSWRVMEKGKLELRPSEEFDRALAQCTPEDFDGHTEFHRLTPEQRLEWLCQAATFVYEFKGKAQPSKPLPSEL